MLENLNLGEPSTLVLSQLLLNLIIAAIVSIIIKIHYRRYGSVITNREEFGNVFPFIVLTTVLVISVVKSSLALSLGLVGALSIVRFRTPIKEPEELAYLFISIAAGLGFGANQTLPTLVSILFILICMSLIKFNAKKIIDKSIYLTIEHNNLSKANSDQITKKINAIIAKQNETFDLKRLDISAESFQVTYLVNIKKIETLEEIIKIIRSEYPDVIINFIDQNQVPSI
jgi:uncharacterized membrane protein YhiD involved in acid resistance|tara:strand:- start:3923 stop:4609 length:687 start_codon:yes stop_codon:yes gene_type:complete